jgi:ATP-dependent RNA helicase RhlE
VSALSVEEAAHDPTPVDFTSLELDPRLHRALHDRRFIRTTPIQSAVFPLVETRGDLIACAQTGTGKTAAFLLPLMQRLLTGRRDDRSTRVTRVLVLVPTRELAVQIEDDFEGFAYNTPLTSVSVYGGVGAGPQAKALRAGVDVVVATPGRLLDHLRDGTANFASVDTLVLDEADRMLDMGFWPDVRRIVSMLPAERQTLFFSATMSNEVLRTAEQLLRQPKLVRIGQSTGLATQITHSAHVVRFDEKPAWLTRFLRAAEGPTIVFVRTKRGADRLARRLAAAGIRCAPLHADRTQGQRTAAVEGFRSARHAVLVATDIAARGLDIDRVAHIVNYEVPGGPDAYVHRVGRTGRAQARGNAVTLVAPEEMAALRSLERSLRLSLVTTN